MKIAIGSIEIKDKNKQHNFNKIKEALIEASKGGANYLFLGEAVLHGFNGLDWDYENDLMKNTESLSSSYILKIRGLCSKHNIGVGIGYYERDKDHIYSSYVVFDKCSKVLANFRRLSVGWKPNNFESSNYKEGVTLPKLKLGKSTCTICICGDLWTEEVLKSLESHDSDTIIWPLYIDYDIEEWEKSAKSEYLNQVKTIRKRTLLINSINELKNGANGGLLDILSDGKINDEIKMLQGNILFVEL